MASKVYWLIFLFIGFICLGGVINNIEAYEQESGQISYQRNERVAELPRASIKTEIKPIKLLTNNPETETKIREIADNLDFKWPDYLIKLATCESRLNVKATNLNNNKPKTSKDRGLFQFNSYWQKRVSDDCAYDLECSTKKAIEMINNGQQHLWVCDSLIKQGVFKI